MISKRPCTFRPQSRAGWVAHSPSLMGLPGSRPSSLAPLLSGPSPGCRGGVVPWEDGLPPRVCGSPTGVGARRSQGGSPAPVLGAVPVTRRALPSPLGSPPPRARAGRLWRLQKPAFSEIVVKAHSVDFTIMTILSASSVGPLCPHVPPSPSRFQSSSLQTETVPAWHQPPAHRPPLPC